MKNRKAWGLVVVLATVLLVGGGAMAAYGHQQGSWQVFWAPSWRDCSVGISSVRLRRCGNCPPDPNAPVVGMTYSLGFATIYVPRRP